MQLEIEKYESIELHPGNGIQITDIAALHEELMAIIQQIIDIMQD